MHGKQVRQLPGDGGMKVEHVHVLLRQLQDVQGGNGGAYRKVVAQENAENGEDDQVAIDIEIAALEMLISRLQHQCSYSAGEETDGELCDAVSEHGARNVQTRIMRNAKFTDGGQRKPWTSSLALSRIAMAQSLDSNSSGTTKDIFTPPLIYKVCAGGETVVERAGAGGGKYGIWPSLQRHVNVSSEVNCGPAVELNGHGGKIENGDVRKRQKAVMDPVLKRAWEAVKVGDVSSLHMMLAHDASLCTATITHDAMGYTLLHWAAKKNHADVCSMLIDARANIDSCNRQGATFEDIVLPTCL